MPCDSIQTNRVKIDRLDPTLRKRAVEKLGWKIVSESQTSLSAFVPGSQRRGEANGYNVTISGDELQVQTRGYGNQAVADGLADKLNTAYLREVVYEGAERFNWEVEEVAQDEFVVRTREAW